MATAGQLSPPARALNDGIWNYGKGLYERCRERNDPRKGESIAAAGENFVSEKLCIWKKEVPSLGKLKVLIDCSEMVWD